MAANGTKGASKTTNGKGRPRKIGRTSKLTPEITTIICDGLARGKTRECAVAASGVSYQSFLNWMERGESSKNGDIYRPFFEAVKKAESKAEDLWLDRLQDDRTPKWQRFAWLLERRFPERWGQKQYTDSRVEQRTEHSGAVEFVLRRVPPREVKASGGVRAEEKEEAG